MDKPYIFQKPIKHKISRRDVYLPEWEVYDANAMDAWLESKTIPKTVVDKEMIIKIIKVNCQNFWKMSSNTKITPYKVDKLADAIISAMYGEQK